jgi:hypothetical protein
MERKDLQILIQASRIIINAVVAPSQKHPVITRQRFHQLSCHVFADGTFAVFHLGKVALADVEGVGEFLLGQAGLEPRAAQQGGGWISQ